MNNIIKFKKSINNLGIVFSVVMLTFSISIICVPEIYLRNILSTARKIQIIGYIGVIYFTTLLYSFIRILIRKCAVRITEEHLIDNSKYESLGKIKWKDISKIQRFKKRNIEIFIDPKYLKQYKGNLLQKFLRFMHNCNHQNSILISSSLLDCSREELFKKIKTSHKRFKQETNTSN